MVGIWYRPYFPSSLHFIFQLTAGPVDVASARIADGCFLARAFQLSNPTLLRCGGAWLVGASFNFVNREKIDMTQESVAEIDKSCEIFLCVGDPFNEEILEANATTGFFDI